MNTKEKLKMNYVSPLIEVSNVQLENTIAAGSARVRTGDVNGSAYEVWEDETEDDKRGIIW